MKNMNKYENCLLCPRKCGINRSTGQTGVCGVSSEIKVARAALHYWEEPCISGKRGSGAVFFSGCSLHCVFCQNREISDGKAGKVISKDPRIKNTGINDAYAYLEVSIPTANVIAAADNGSRLEKRVQELFSFQSKASWTKLNSQKVGNKQVYVFAYNKILKPQETTESLFDTVKFLNIIEGQLDGQQLEIPVRAYAIQASYTGGDAENVVEQARSAYQKYVDQNKNQPGQVTE